MNIEYYRRGRRYAWALDKELCKDIVHDAYVTWWDKYEKDLFDEHIGTIFLTIKYTFLAYLKSNVWFFRGESQGPRKFERFEDIFNSGDEEKKRLELELFNPNTPEDEYIAAELLGEYMELIRSVPKDRAVFTGNENTTKEILTKRLNGYTNKEIAEELGISQSGVTYYLNKIKLNKFETRNKKKMVYTNPFRGSKTVVTKKMGEVAWGNRDDHDTFQFEDSNEEYILYFHKESKEGLLVKISDPKSSEFYIKRLVDSKK